ncbi:MAG: hypothetical protein QOJ64_57 [Acidobacteriota bacterium]|jgi:hypothetical protein|nr:hypothetical protein [Acidobacteriota bacterium]
MNIAALVLLAMMTGGTGAAPSRCIQLGPTQQAASSSGQQGQISASRIKITIATGGIPYRANKNTFRAGEPVPLVITMTNTGSDLVHVCESGTLYQDRPQLLRDGKPLVYTSFRQSMMQVVERDKTCNREDLPQQILLPPNEPTVVDWSNLVEGASSLYEDGWYESLPAGKYTLIVRRRLSCCDGPFIESNTITFEVVP